MSVRSRACARLLTLLALVATLGCGGAPAPERPHILLLSIDTLSRRALDGDPPLPRVEALARSSVRFEMAISPAAWTLPAQASLLTGLYPDRHGATDPRVGVSEAAPRLAEALRERGYETVAFTDAGFLNPDYGFGRGFDRYDGGGESEALAALELPRGGEHDAPRGREIFDRAVAYLESRAPGAPPLFLFLQTYSVHDYYHARPWATTKLPEFDDAEPGAYLDCLQGLTSCPPRTFERLEALYRAELPHLDRGLGRLLDALTAAGMDEATVVAFVSDHGESFDWRRKRLHHGGRLHEDLLRVPLFLRVPGVTPRSVPDPVSLVDVAPTLLELAGATPPEGIDGVSLLPVLREGLDPPRRAIYAMEHSYLWQEGERRTAEVVYETPVSLAVVRGGFWLVHYKERDELYALDDLEQANDLSDQPAQSDRLQRLRQAARRRAAARPATPRVQVEGELLEQLRTLGYAE